MHREMQTKDAQVKDHILTQKVLNTVNSHLRLA